MRAATFLDLFKRGTENLAMKGTDDEWTTRMYRALSDICREGGLYPVHEVREDERGVFGDGERMSLDMLYGVPVTDKKTKRERASNWYLPRVVIEHENGKSFRHVWRDFRKACLYAIPLRVTIGYGQVEKGTEGALNNGTKLMEFYAKHGLRQVSDGETLLIMGWPQTTVPLQWHVWLLGREGEQAADLLHHGWEKIV